MMGTIGANFYSISIVFVSALVLRYRRFLFICAKTLPRDLIFISRCLIAIGDLMICHFRRETILTLFQKRVKQHPNKVIFHFQDTEWTIKELDQYSNKISRIFQKKGYENGDVVALMSLNKPEYVGIWLGLGKIGVITALINTNLKSQSLAHCVNVAKCKGFIFTDEFEKEVDEIRDLLPPQMEYIIYGKESSKFENATFRLNELLGSMVNDTAIVPQVKVSPRNKLLYIYTSGTTGLPKAAIMTHQRLNFVVTCVTRILKINRNDIIYDPLPLYHTAGGILGILPSLVYGSSTVIRSKFSASNYFADCRKYNCTIGQYIGEMCRYILATPPSSDDTNHSLKMVLGNGVKPDVWKLFVERFKIPYLIELYGSTEGNSNIVNIDNRIGAVGFKPSFVPKSLFTISLIKYDESTGEPIRDRNGFCIRCDIDEPGMCVGLIRKDAIRGFEGYVDENETSKKIIHNVFTAGDSAFLSGDILYMDELGYLYFKDRTGDTFRWKGENVSTGEIEMITQQLINFKDCTVYGVKIGNLEGRAGMVAIVDPEREVNLENLAMGFDKTLPSYAKPLFLRILTEIQLTGTYKVIKTDLKNEGFNINVVKDPIYFKDPVKGFVPMTESLYNDIINGVVKL